MNADFSLDGRRPPQVDDLGFDRRLMSAERLLRLTGRTRFRFSEGGIPQLYLDHCDCGRAIEVLTDRHGGCYTVSVQQFLANVLRHQVMAHDLSLAGGNGNES